MSFISLVKRMEIYHNTVNELSQIYPKDEARSIARLLLEKLTGWNLHQLITDKNLTLSSEQANIIKHYLEELKLQKPVQYILGEAYFFNLTFKVTSNVLIPRPETEELVSWIIESNSNSKKTRILDIGTGSGCIAIALAKNILNSEVFATDVSDKALSVALENSKTLETNVTFLMNNILGEEEISESPFDIIVSNPPYVCESEKKLMKPNVLENEPELALFVPDNDPLKFYSAIAKKARALLNPNGLIFCEINEMFGNETKVIFNEFGYKSVEIRKDIHGKHRMLKASRE